MANDAKAQWNDVVKFSRMVNEHRDCAVKALALATDTHYIDVHSLMLSKGRKHRCSTYNHVTYATLRHLGFEVEKVECRAKTVRTIEREFKYRPGTYLVWVSGNRHILALKEGEIIDWTKDRQHRIKRVERVIPKRQTQAATG